MDRAGTSFHVLGPLELRRHGQPVWLGSGRQRRLLTCLLLAARPMPTDEVVEAVWGAQPPAAARSALKTHASHLRSLFDGDDGTALVGRRGSYELVTPDGAVDARCFEALLVAPPGEAPGARRDRLGAGLALWRGPAYADVDGWAPAVTEAHRLHELQLRAVEERIAADLDLGHHERVVAELQALVAEHPLRERLHGHLMVALYRNGRQAEALRAFGALRRTLRNTLGVAPTPELAALELAILDHHPRLAHPARAATGGSRGAPPQPVTRLIGRDDDVAAVVALLRDHRIVTVLGPGGVGKTRVAAEVARGHGEAPVRFVDLSAVAIGDGEGVVRAVAAAVDAPAGLPGAAGLADAVVDALAERRLLLVLDNCEHVVEPVVGLLATLLPAAAGVTVLATSRQALAVPGEWRWPLRPLEAGDGTDADAPAVQLFLERAEAVRPGFACGGADHHAIAALCRRLDGLPLAIELAAAQVHHLEPAELAGRIDLALGDPLRRGDRHRTLRATVDWSYGLLHPDEQVLLDRLAVFAGPASLGAVERVCFDDAPGRRQAPALLGSLVARSLVSTVEQGRSHRYRLLDTVRAYAAEHLEARGETGWRRGLLLDHLVEEAESRPSHEATLSTEAAAVFRANAPNLALAFDAAVAAGRLELVGRLLAATGARWRQGGAAEFDECRRHLAMSLDAASQLDPSTRLACRALAVFCARMAVDPADEERHVAAVLADPSTPANGHLALVLAAHAHRLGVRSGLVGDGGLVDRALATSDDAVALARTLERPWRIPVLWERGNLCLVLGDHGGAAASLAAAVEDLDGVDAAYRVEESMVRASLGLALHLTGDDTTAQRAVAPAVAGWAEGRTAWMTNQPVAYAAVVMAAAGQMAEARELLAGSLPLAAGVSTALNVSDFLIAAAAVDALEGHCHRAGVLLGAARALGRGFPVPFRTPMGLALYRTYRDRLRGELGAENARRAHQRGLGLSSDEALELALAAALTAT